MADIDRLYRALKQQCGDHISNLVTTEETIFNRGSNLSFGSEGQEKIREHIRIHLDFHNKNYQIHRMLEQDNRKYLIYSFDWLVDSSFREMIKLFGIADELGLKLSFVSITDKDSKILLRFFMVVEDEEKIKNFKETVQQKQEISLSRWRKIIPSQLPNILRFNPS